MQRSSSIRSHRPAGFSLIELLVVIGIIATLVGIAVAVWGNMMESAREAATRTTIAKIEGLLQSQITAWRKEFEGSNVVAVEAETNPLFAGYATAQQRQLAALKTFFQTHFPQRAIEATGSAYTGWTAGGNEADNAELLYLTLTKGKFRGVTPVDEDSFTGEVQDTDGDGFMELVDGWQRPFRFYRWPTRLLNPRGFVAETLDSNISDSAGLITTNALGPSEPRIQDVFNDLQSASPPGNLYLLVGTEIMRVTGVSGGNINVDRGVKGSVRAVHPAGSLVKVLPLEGIIALAFGSLNLSSVAHDPDDPRGDFNPATLPNTTASPGGPVQDFEAAFHTLDSYHTPLIVSAGSDGEFGLEDPADTANFGYLAMPSGGAAAFVNPGATALADNITNQSGGN